MPRALRSVLLAALVCSACLVASACAFAGATLNRSTGAAWHVESLLFAAAAVAVAALARRAVLELAAAAVAGGLLANSLAAGVCGGVADFVHAGGWVYSPGDLAVLAGGALLAIGTARLALAR